MIDISTDGPRLPAFGEVVQGYEVVARIGSGGMATLLLVRRRGVGGFEKRFAMKVMHPHLADEQKFVDLFLDEARIASSIEHSNVVHVFDVGVYKGLPWLVMELLQGQPLSALKRDDLPSLEVRMGILAETADGLHAAHEACGRDGKPMAIVHRDVSPQNIHVSYDGHVRVLDFGIAAARGRISRTATGEVRGKFSYLAPEQLEHPGERVDRRVDLWALGIVAWELFAEQRLFKGHADADKLHRILHMPIPKVPEVAPDVPESVAALIDACLSRDPDARPRDAAAIAAGMRAALGNAQLSYRDELARYMEDRFGEVRRKTEEQLSALRAPESPTMPTVHEPLHKPAPAESVPTPAPARKKSRAPIAIAIGSVALLGVAGAIVYARYGNAAAPAQPRERAQEEPHVNAPAPSTPAATVARAPRHITVAIGSGVRRVLVDGAQRDDRPLRVSIPENGRVHVELIGRNGRTVAHELGAEDDGASFDMARARRPTKRRSNNLMDSPY